MMAAPVERKVWTSSQIPWVDCDAERRRVLHAAWSTGSLDYLLTPSQLRTNAKMDAWSKSPKRQGRIYVLDSSRRWGKSALLLKRALEKAIRNPGWRIVYFAPEYKMVRKILLPLMAILTQDCPPKLLGPKQGPDWAKAEDTFYFANGSRIELYGLDTNPNGARGGAIDYCFGDEVAFFNDLGYVVQSIIMPMMFGRKHARLECASTPPVSPSHFWTQTMVPDAIQDGAHDIRTIEDADQYSAEEVEEFIRIAGGRDSTICLREYFCQHITDETLAVVPEFRHAEKIVCRAPEKVPQWRNCFVSMDPGWHDHTGVLFGYWDFGEAMPVIEDEFSGPKLTSAEIAAEIKRKELALWKDVPRKPRENSGTMRTQPRARVTDWNDRLQQDMWNAHELHFQRTLKDNKEQQVNAMRIAIGQHRIRIHPRCTKLIKQLRFATWKSIEHKNKLFSRDGTTFGHFDLVDALIYLLRIMDQFRHENPAPKEARYVLASNSQDPGAPRAKLQGGGGHSRWTYRRGQFFVR